VRALGAAVRREPEPRFEPVRECYCCEDRGAADALHFEHAGAVVAGDEVVDLRGIREVEQIGVGRVCTGVNARNLDAVTALHTRFTVRPISLGAIRYAMDVYLLTRRSSANCSTEVRS
jgi:hypothetical protein